MRRSEDEGGIGKSPTLFFAKKIFIRYVSINNKACGDIQTRILNITQQNSKQQNFIQRKQQHHIGILA